MNNGTFVGENPCLRANQNRPF